MRKIIRKISDFYFYASGIKTEGGVCLSFLGTGPLNMNTFEKKIEKKLFVQKNSNIFEKKNSNMKIKFVGGEAPNFFP